MPTNLEYFRKQAKALLKAAHRRRCLRAPTHRANRAQTHRRSIRHCARAGIRQLAAIPRLHRPIRSRRSDPWLTAFIDAAVSDFRRAEELLAAHPAIAGGGYYVALVLGDVGTVEQSILASPELATSASGPQKLEPLLYVCFSRYANAQVGSCRRSGRNRAPSPATRRQSRRIFHTRGFARQSALLSLRRDRAEQQS